MESRVRGSAVVFCLRAPEDGNTARTRVARDSQGMSQEQKPNPSSTFTRLAQWCSIMTGRPIAFSIAFALIVLWLVTGPIFGFSDTWQLIINTSTTIITFLMVFLIQNSQNRDTQAIQIKLDELIRATSGAHVALLDLEKLSEEELAVIRKDYGDLAELARGHLAQGGSDTDVPEIEPGRVR
jgi:low affinity Fe/Cu permease